VCPNLDGAQTSIPQGYILFDGGCWAEAVIIESAIKERPNEYTLLEPLGGLKVFKIDQECAFGNYLDLMVTIFIGIAAVLAMVMIVVGGLEYMTSELVSAKADGKEKIRNAVLGLLLALGAFLILKTINPDLVNICFDALEEIRIEQSFDLPQAPINGRYCSEPDYLGGSLENLNWNNSVWPELTPLPAGIGIDISGGTSPCYGENCVECEYVGQKSCTSLRGFDTQVVEKAKDWCGESCEVIITGGTECWEHSRSGSHKPGSSTVDLRFTPTLDAWVLEGKENVQVWDQIPKRNPSFWAGLGNALAEGYTVGFHKETALIFTKEPNHWHVYWGKVK